MPQKALTTALFFAVRSLLLVVKASVVVALCMPIVSSRIPTALENVLERGALHVVSRNGPTTYYEHGDGYTGFEYELAHAFADYLGVELVIHEGDEIGQLLYNVENQQFDFAAAGLTVTEQRQRKVLFSQPYLKVTQQLVYRHGDSKPKGVADLVGKKIVVIGNSSHSEQLNRLKRQHPGLIWEERYDVEMLDLMEMVHEGEIDATIVDSNAYEYNSSLYPRAHVAFEISQPQDMAWAFPLAKDDSLYKQAQKFFELQSTNTLIAERLDTYFGHLGKLNYSDALVFTSRIDNRLPKWRGLLQEAAEKYELNWQLLAAMSYQESHWNPRAKSPTGVRGFMMLTQPTAKEVGVTNRLDATQSIFGGAKYFRKIHNRIPARIAEPDRTWMALAAYNMGTGHLEDARKITQAEGANPDKWADVSERVLLLEKRKYYKFTKHGYARGSEAFGYVQNIRNFQNIIAWAEFEKQQVAQETPKPTEFAQLSPVVTDAVKSLAVEAL